MKAINIVSTAAVLMVAVSGLAFAQQVPGPPPPGGRTVEPRPTDKGPLGTVTTPNGNVVTGGRIGADDGTKNRAGTENAGGYHTGMVHNGQRD